MKPILATGLLAMAIHAFLVAPALPQAFSDGDAAITTILDRDLRDTPDAALRDALSDPGTPDARRMAIRREIGLRDRARSDPLYGKTGPRDFNHHTYR